MKTKLIPEARAVDPAEMERCTACGEYFDRRNLEQVIAHCFEGHRPASSAPFRAWIRSVGDLPREMPPRDAKPGAVRKLQSGEKVFLDFETGGEVIRGWGTLRRSDSEHAWEVEFPDGSAVGLPEEQMLRVVTARRKARTRLAQSGTTPRV